MADKNHTPKLARRLLVEHWTAVISESPSQLRAFIQNWADSMSDKEALQAATGGELFEDASECTCVQNTNDDSAGHEEYCARYGERN